MHVLSTPPAFILSQDQTLKLKFVSQLLTDFLFPKITFALSSCELTLGFGLFSTVQFSRFNVFFASSSRRQRYLYYQISHFLSRTFFIYFFQVFNLDLNLSVFVCRFSRRQDGIILSLRKKSTLFLNFFQLFFKNLFSRLYILYIVPFTTYIYIFFRFICFLYSVRPLKLSGFLP